MKHFEVAAAIIINNNEILCMQRNESKYDYVSFKYEFPGGKIEKSESNVQALMRELVEEMDFCVNITPEDYFLTVEHEYPDFSITMHSYICHVSNRQFTRKEHYSHVWLKVNELDTLDWAAADLPIVRKLMEDMK
jgi:8-oxo-dGTP diphosphatase